MRVAQPLQVYPGASYASNDEFKWKTDDSANAGGNTDVMDDEISALGSQFAYFISEKNRIAQEGIKNGMNVKIEKEQKQYPPFRKSVFMDTRYMPGLQYTHICYEFDAQFGEMEKHWSRAGKKFSDEPRIGKPRFSAAHGPRNPYEHPKFCEREQRVFGAVRQIRPFSSAQRYTRPLDRCTLPYKPTSDEANAHLGPGAYKYPDQWVKTVHGDGNIAGTQPFLSQSPLRDYERETVEKVFIREEPTLAANKATARLYHQQLTGSPTRVRTASDYSRSVIDRSLNPGSTRVAQQYTDRYGGDYQVRDVSMHTETSKNSPAQSRPRTSQSQAEVSRSRMSTSQSLKPSSSQSTVRSLQQLTSAKSDPALYNHLVQIEAKEYGNTFVSQDMLSPIRKTGQKELSTMEKNKLRGVSIGKGKPGKSSLDIITGTSDADKKYRRLKLNNGSTVIYQMNQDSNANNMPKGAYFTDDWATTGIYAEKDPALTVSPQKVQMLTNTDKKNKSIPGPSQVIGPGPSPEKTPVLIQKIRPQTAAVECSLPGVLSTPKVYPGYEEYRTPIVVNRSRLSTPFQPKTPEIRLSSGLKPPVLKASGLSKLDEMFSQFTDSIVASESLETSPSKASLLKESRDALGARNMPRNRDASAKLLSDGSIGGGVTNHPYYEELLQSEVLIDDEVEV